MHSRSLARDLEFRILRRPIRLITPRPANPGAFFIVPACSAMECNA